MKLTKEILEAVNKGIKLALDDYEDIEDSVSSNNDIISSSEDIKKYITINQITVDLGLPSGTLWCKYNLGTNQRKLTQSADAWYGKYYAWGETRERTIYSWERYKYAIAKYNTITKYNVSQDYAYGVYGESYLDNFSILRPEDDAATKYLGKPFHIPTTEQIVELIANTKAHHKENYLGVNGLNGVLYVSNINGNKIFFPNAGYKNAMNKQEDEYTHRGRSGRYWTSNLFVHDSRDAYAYTTPNCLVTSLERRCGFSIRPVCN